jgi:hypothetical protein
VPAGAVPIHVVQTGLGLPSNGYYVFFPRGSKVAWA